MILKLKSSKRTQKPTSEIERWNKVHAKVSDNARHRGKKNKDKIDTENEMKWREEKNEIKADR